MLKLLNMLNNINYEDIDIDEFLDKRENKTFDSEWIRVYNNIEKLKKNKNIKDNKDICKKAYIIVFEKTECDELAGYISDDFGMISDSKMLNYSDEWLNKLIDCYEKCEIPCGKL